VPSSSCSNKLGIPFILPVSKETGVFHLLNLPSIRELDEMARVIALIEPNPQDLAGWVNYLLEQLEAESQMRGKEVEFEEILRSFGQGLNK